MESVQESKKSGKAYVLKPVIDGSTLKDTAFNNHRWADVTCDYVTSMKKLTKESFKEICSRARQMSKSTRRGGQSGSPSVEDAPKRIGQRAQLLDACEFTLQHLLYSALSCATGARTILCIIG